MLERWKTVLDERLLERCIKLSPEGAVRYALAEIPDHLREDYLFDNAAIALDVCRAELSETDWCICARALPEGNLRPQDVSEHAQAGTHPRNALRNLVDAPIQRIPVPGNERKYSNPSWNIRTSGSPYISRASSSCSAKLDTAGVDQSRPP